MKEIRHRIRGKTVTIETTGFGGESCKAATEAIERKLGKKVSDVESDDVYHVSENENETVKQ